MVRSFALVYAEMSMERASPAERLAAVRQLHCLCFVQSILKRRKTSAQRNVDGVLSVSSGTAKVLVMEQVDHGARGLVTCAVLDVRCWACWPHQACGCCTSTILMPALVLLL